MHYHAYMILLILYFVVEKVEKNFLLQSKISSEMEETFQGAASQISFICRIIIQFYFSTDISHHNSLTEFSALGYFIPLHNLYIIITY